MHIDAILFMYNVVHFAPIKMNVNCQQGFGTCSQICVYHICIYSQLYSHYSGLNLNLSRADTLGPDIFAPLFYRGFLWSPYFGGCVKIGFTVRILET